MAVALHERMQRRHRSGIMSSNVMRHILLMTTLSLVGTANAGMGKASMGGNAGKGSKSTGMSMGASSAGMSKGSDTEDRTVDQPTSDGNEDMNDVPPMDGPETPEVPESPITAAPTAPAAPASPNGAADTPVQQGVDRLVSPCHCEPVFAPVCCRTASYPSGLTYASSCDAACAGCDANSGAARLEDGPCMHDDGPRGTDVDTATFALPDGYAWTMREVTCAGSSATQAGLHGDGASLDLCIHACTSVEDCHFVSYTSAGGCQFWETCDRVDNQPGALVFARDVHAAPPEPAIVPAGYVLDSMHDVCEDAGGTGAVPASISGSSDVGLTPSACADGCNSVHDCMFASLSGTGECRYWITCGTRRLNRDGHVYRRVDRSSYTVAENFTILSTTEVCTFAASNNGRSRGGYDLEPCLAGCRLIDDCAYVSYSKDGVCRYWADCGNREAATDIQLFARAATDMLPPVYQFSLIQLNAMCTAGGASIPALWGEGHALTTCIDACSEILDCNFVTHTNSGYCRFWTTCDNPVGHDSANVYLRTAADRENRMALLSRGSFCSGTFAPYRGPWGDHHSVASCLAACADETDCNFATVAGGHCRFWSTCALEAREGSEVYGKFAIMPQHESSALTGHGASSRVFDGAVVALSVIGAVALVVVAIITFRHRQQNRPFEEAIIERDSLLPTTVVRVL
eukprot:m.112438 g.112438  ORF g.112438 m.112438 type:complete len:687 (-) comp10783_c0_seq1:1181-3241(-)